MHWLWRVWGEGGVTMAGLLAVLLVSAHVVIDRGRWFWRSAFDAELLFAQVEERVRAGDVAEAVTLCTLVRAPVVRVALAGITHLHRGGAEVRAAVAQAMLREAPRAEGRVGWLPTLAQVAALLGFLGTIGGLVCPGFHCVGGHGGEGGPTIDPARKAEMLAGSMSDSFRCTQVGLMAALVAGVGYALFRALGRARERELEAAAAWTVALADAHRARGESAVPYR